MDDKLPIVAGSNVYLRFGSDPQIGEVLSRQGSLSIRVRWPDGTEETREASNLVAVRSFEWKRWSGGHTSVTGVVRVEFGPSHVVFYGPDDHVVLSERVEQVNELHETTRRR